jgi:superfamily II DNA or RNA helicase
VRGRDWVVQPSDDADVLVIKPLGGTEDETTVIYLPLAVVADTPRDAQFALPTAADIGDLKSARLLYEATRLSFRNGAGPFRSLGKVSFRPRSYQMVPLIMALKQPVVRLLVADDVGVGKTIEALLIAREMLERRLITRFAVLCPPHLCEQWQDEIRTKLDIDAVIIRSNTQAALERDIHGDVMIYQHYKYQIISIDYIKSDIRSSIFVNEAPELIIVDEAHTATQGAGANAGQQQRHALLDRLAQRPQQHMVFLTATPHSGKPDQFQSLLKLLRPEFASLDLSAASPAQRSLVAKHYIQRQRADVAKWLGDDTPFPQRDSVELRVTLGNEYRTFLDDLLDFTSGMVRTQPGEQRNSRIKLWTALALLRAAVSSPRAGSAVLTTRLQTLQRDDVDFDADLEHDLVNPVGDSETFLDSDAEPTQLSEHLDWNESQRRTLRSLRTRIDTLATPAQDAKLSALADVVNAHLRDGFQPVIFCRYILTAKYLGEHLPALLKPSLAKSCAIEVVTSEDPDDVRRQRIRTLGESERRVLIATDCLSEGINLQDSFTAVIHYDLPWNPNRLEQREGRVDRFGQPSPVVKTCLMYCEADIDAIVLDILLRKVREIRRTTGVHVPFPIDSQSVIDTITQALFQSGSRVTQRTVQSQLTFDFDQLAEANQYKAQISREVEAAASREKVTRSLFAQHAIPAHEIEQDLRDVDEALGDPLAVQTFVVQALQHVFGMQVVAVNNQPQCFRIAGNMPLSLQHLLGKTGSLAVSFASPTPKGYLYLGRNHPFVEHLCQYILSHTMDRIEPRAARVSVIRTAAVPRRTVITMLRCRNVIEPTTHAHQLVAEEMVVWGWQGSGTNRLWLEHHDAKKLLFDAIPSEYLSPEAQALALADACNDLAENRTAIDTLAERQAAQLVASHERFSALLKEHRFQVVHPVLPMDVLGIYVLLPA